MLLILREKEKRQKIEDLRLKYLNVPVKVELVNILTIFELTGGRDFKDPAKIESIIVSSIFLSF